MTFWHSPRGWLLVALVFGCGAIGVHFLGFLRGHSEVGLVDATVGGGSEPMPRILVDQLGYRPQDPKVAVIASSPSGSNTQRAFAPGATYEVRHAATNQVVFSGSIAPWNNGNIHPQSGDRAWRFDFSSVKTPGPYIVVDRDRGERSFPFEIQANVYQTALVAATRMFYYQRSGFAKTGAIAGQWQDGAAYLGPNQDTQARSVSAKTDPKTARDLRGGWFDAGDTNKYTTFAAPVVNQLLTAYEQNPRVFTDRFNIPESGNGIPDLIDEIKWEVDWLKRMQEPDGGVLIKVGVIDYNAADRPSRDQRPRYYAPQCSSASIAAAAAFAHAARIYQQIPALRAEATDLEQRAIRAWNWFQTNPRQTDCDTQEIKAGDADRPIPEQNGNAAAAAVHLFALTGNREYSRQLATYLPAAQAWNDSVWSRYRPHEGDALLLYSRLPNADPALAKQIRDRFVSIVRTQTDAYGPRPDLDPYGVAMPDAQYHWGSNQVQANYGNSNWDAIRYAADPSRQANFQARALAHLHYLHGVNPLGWMYLTNMKALGAERSVNAIYHEWLGKGNYERVAPGKPGPAPGYLVGGPNRNYRGNEEAIKREPIQKRYLDSSAGGDIKSWELSEPAIYYQAAYIRLLASAIDR